MDSDMQETFNQADVPQAFQRGSTLWYVGLNREIESGYDQALLSQKMIPAIQHVMESDVQGIVVATEGFVVRGSESAIGYFCEQRSSIRHILRAQSRIIGEKLKMQIQAIQQHLMEQGKVRAERCVPVMLMPDVIDLEKARSLFEELWRLIIKGDDELGERVWQSIPPPFRKTNSLLRRNRVERYADIPEEICRPLPGPSWATITYLKDSGVPDEVIEEIIATHHENLTLPIKERYFALNEARYALLQLACSLLQGGVKASFAGEEGPDKTALFCAKERGEKLSLDEVSRGLSILQLNVKRDPSIARLWTPYQTLLYGRKSTFPVLTLATWSPLKDLDAVANHVKEVMREVFPSVELELRIMRENKNLSDSPSAEWTRPEAFDYLKEMLEENGDQSLWQQALLKLGIIDNIEETEFSSPYPSTVAAMEAGGAIKPQYGTAMFSGKKKPILKPELRTKEPIRKATQRQRVMELLREMATALDQNSILSQILKDSGITSELLYGHSPMSDLPIVIPPLTKMIAQVTYLRARVERLEIQHEKYNQTFLWRVESMQRICNEVFEELEKTRRELMNLVVYLQKSEIVQEGDIEEYPEIYFMEYMAKILSVEVHKNPQLAESLNDFFHRLTVSLMPDYKWKIDLSHNHV